MPKLTKRIVDAATTTEPQAIIWDSEVKGFGLRVTGAGSRSYVLNYRTGAGRSRRYTIGKHGSPWTCEGARDKAIAVMRALSDGVDPLDSKASAKVVITVAELVGLYLSDGPAEKPNKKASSWASDTSNFKRHVLPLIGDKSIKTLAYADISRFQADVAAGKTAADVKTGPRGRAMVKGGKPTAARSVAVLGAALQFGVGRGLLSANPAKGVVLFKGEKKERFLTDRELIALADALAVMEDDASLNPTMATAIRLLLLTGCRKGEVLNLQWPWVDFERGCLRLPDSKTGAKVVPLAAAALDVLADLPRTSKYVLPSAHTGRAIVGLQKAWSTVRVRATDLARRRALEDGEPIERAPQLLGVRLHDLRHSYASFAVADGATLFLVGKVLGHKQTRTTEIYAHLHDDPLKAVADRTGAKIADALRVGASREKPKDGIVVPSRRRR
jgi:integrase